VATKIVDEGALILVINADRLNNPFYYETDKNSLKPISDVQQISNSIQKLKKVITGFYYRSRL
jgi:hypothetical protein